MHVVVNGAPREVPRKASVGALLTALGIDPARVVVERNGVVVERQQHDAEFLAEGDRLEIVRFVGGG